MNENLPPLSYVILTFVAAFAGTIALGVLRWMSDGVKSSIIKAVRLMLSGILWPFHWAATAVKEWRRVSVYRHRRITWADLPDELKIAVHIQDLSDMAQRLIVWDHLPQQAKGDVRFHDLSEGARASIGLSDLPLVEKRNVLDKFIFPKLFGTQHDGELSLLDDRNYITLQEASQVTFPKEEDYRAMDQDGMLLDSLISFESPETEIALQRDARIGFTCRYWTAAGNVRRRTRVSPGTQRVEVRVTIFSFDGLSFFTETDQG